MQFWRIEKSNGHITITEWERIIESHSSLMQAPERKAINPVTKEETIISNIGVAYYVENNESEGNICLEEGVLLSTGVPEHICKGVADILKAKLYQSDCS